MRIAVHRRGFACAAILFVMTAACAQSEPAQESQDGQFESESVVFGGVGGVPAEVLAEACFPAFTSDTGVVVNPVEPFIGLGLLRAQVESGQPEIDVMWVPAHQAQTAVEDNLMEKLDWTVIDKSRLSPNQYEHPWGDYGVTFDLWGTVLAYHTDKWSPDGEHPSTWADLYDVDRFPGARAMGSPDAVGHLIGTASAATGRPYDQSFPPDLDAVTAELEELKPHVSLWWEQTTQAEQALLREEADVAQVPIHAAFRAIQQGAPYATSDRTRYSIGTLFVIPKGARHPRAASKLIEYCAAPETTALYAEKGLLGTENHKALDLIDPEVLPMLTNSEEFADRTIVVDSQWVGENLDELSTWFEEYLGR